MEFIELVNKYNQPGPRYTSYPTALQFSEDVSKKDLMQDLEDSEQPLSLYAHLPFCESLCWFCACTTVITCNRDQVNPYLDGLEKEIALYGSSIDRSRKVAQLHFGGGSPSFPEPDQLDRLCTMLRREFTFTEDAECSVELDPRTLTEEKVKVFANHGFRRASFGVQDINPEVQKAVHRIQPDVLNRKALEWIHGSGFESVNIDLIYGLPLQTVESFRETLKTVLTYNPDRFAVFSYAHVPWVAPAQKILARNQLPSPETKLAMLQETIETLTAAGYRYIGMDHFAKEGDDLCQALDEDTLHRNFQGYTTRAGLDLCGFGMSSISQGKASFRQNFKTLESWYKALAEDKVPIEKGYCLTKEDLLRRDVIVKLMCSGILPFSEIEEKHSIHFASHFADALAHLEPMAKDGLIELSRERIEVTALGRQFLRNIAMPFDAYYVAKAGRHAKTI